MVFAERTGWTAANRRRRAALLFGRRTARWRRTAKFRDSIQSAEASESSACRWCARDQWSIRCIVAKAPGRSELWAGATVHFHEAAENWQVIFGR